MITISESQFLFIILATGIISYIIFSIFFKCDIKCEINYKRQNTIREKPKVIKKVVEKVIERNHSYKPDVHFVDTGTETIGNHVSAHTSPIVPRSLYMRSDNEKINRLFGY